MVFVLREGCDFLPTELARLHAFDLGLEDELALPPWAIDDATDLLYEHRATPSDCLWLAADNLNALFWGLHDWAHFHSHGPFEERAWTELQCDVSALAWLWMNRREVEISEAGWDSLRGEVEALSRTRFAAEGKLEPDGPALHELLQDAKSIEPGHPAHVEEGLQGRGAVDERK